MAIFFITGIDTGIGKTWATGMAARYLHRQGKKVITQKLVQTGQCSGISEDILEHRRLTGILPLPEDSPLPRYPNGSLTCPYSFAYPASPHFAAGLEKCTIEPEQITLFTERLHHQFDTLLLEGAGGFLTPLTSSLLTADYIEQRGYPVVLVTSGRLGSINHTLLTLEAVHRRNLFLACLVFNQYPLDDEGICTDSFRFFHRICPHVVIMPGIDSQRIPDVDFSCLL